MKLRCTKNVPGHRVPAHVFAVAVEAVMRLAVAATLAFLLIDGVLFATSPLDNADQHDDEQQERDDAHHSDEPTRRRLQRLFEHFSNTSRCQSSDCFH